MEVIEFESFLGNAEEIVQNLAQFVSTHGKRTAFDELRENDLRNRVWTRLFGVLDNAEYRSAHTQTLEALRVLSRDKTEVNELMTEERIAILLKFAGLDDNAEDENVPRETTSRVEALKVLCNLIYHSHQARTFVIQTSCISNTIKLMSERRSLLTHEGRLFYVRLLFLLTALSVGTRNIVKNELKGDVCLVEILAEVSKRRGNRDEDIIGSDDSAIASEVLKVLFNLYIKEEKEETEDEKYQKLVSVLYELLIRESLEMQEELKSHVVNLLTVVPTSSYSALIPPLIKSEDKPSALGDVDTKAVSVLLKFLEQRLDAESDQTENILPIVTVLIRLTKAQRLARKYVRLQILPPLKDVMKRPEEGTTIRAKMCKHLTSPHTDLRDLVAELIFILCKENVGRMVKYTGYGNAAGMFANKGLLGGRQSETDYSSESEDSDTDEYTKYKEQINPITGCYESPKPNPMENMSEERKEYEAVQLAQLMDKLTREGIVQPCRIGEDGRPKPIEHVLELQSDSK